MESTNIKDLFGRSGSYIIPSYQRAYSWETRQLEQFIDDLRDTSDGKYYLGHFLFETPEDTKEKFLIDGQQRLTTVVVFFSSIRKALLKYSEEENIKKKCNYISDHYLREPYEDKPHLYTVENDRTFFIHEIIDRDEFYPDQELKTSSQKRIRECRVFFDDVFRPLLDMQSYGHDIECSWLIWDAAERFIAREGRDPWREMCLDLLESVTERAFTGHGLHYETVDGNVNTTRAWWTQAETMLGFEFGWRETRDPIWLSRMRTQWKYILRTGIDPRERSEWFNELREDGTLIEGKPMVDEWKCPYHNGRMCLRLMDARLPEE